MFKSSKKYRSSQNVLGLTVTDRPALGTGPSIPEPITVVKGNGLFNVQGGVRHGSSVSRQPLSETEMKADT